MGIVPIAALSRAILRLRVALGLERNLVVLTAAGILQGLGAALWIGFLPKFLEELGARGLAIGAFSTIASLLWVVFPYVGGLMSDRLGRTQVLILGSLLAAAGHAVYMIAPTWWVLLPGVVLTTAAASFGFMGSMALTGEVVRSRRRATSMAARGLLVALPAIMGPPLGGLLIDHVGTVRGVRICLLLTIVLTLAAVWLQHRFYRPIPPPEPAHDRDSSSFWRTAPSALKHLLVADSLLRFGSCMSATFMVLYVVNVLGVSKLEFGSLTALMTAIAVALSLPIAKLSDRDGHRTRRPVVAATYLLFAAFPLALAIIPTAAWLVPVFVIGGLSHVGEPTRKALIIDLAEGPHRGRLIGMYHTIRGAVVLPSALIGGWLWEWRPDTPFLIGSGISALGLVWFLLFKGRRR